MNLELNFVFSNSFNNPVKTESPEPRTRYNNYSEPFNEKLKLYNFQKEGVQFIEKCRGRALIADEMGLGKTVQVIPHITDEIKQRIYQCANS